MRACPGFGSDRGMLLLSYSDSQAFFTSQGQNTVERR